jgi:hypothetical protein
MTTQKMIELYERYDANRSKGLTMLLDADGHYAFEPEDRSVEGLPVRVSHQGHNERTFANYVELAIANLDTGFYIGEIESMLSLKATEAAR